MPGPGQYVPDATEGLIRVEDLPEPKIEPRSRSAPRRPCPHCGRSAPRVRTYTRTLHDLGDSRSGRPRNILFTYSQHRCPHCQTYFNTDLTDLASPRSLYTLRVVHTAVRLVVEDGLPYGAASWHLWRDHRVFVPPGTIQNWVEAGGKKGGRNHHRRVSGPRPEGFLRLHRRRRTL